MPTGSRVVVSWDENTTPVPWWVLGAAGFVLGAVASEVLGGAAGVAVGAEWATWH